MKIKNARLAVKLYSHPSNKLKNSSGKIANLTWPKEFSPVRFVWYWSSLIDLAMTKLSELMLKHWINLIKWLGSSLGNSNGIQTVFIRSFLTDKFEISRVFKDILNPLI